MNDWAEHMHCAITVCDREGTVIYMNERSRETFNKNGESMVGKNLFPCHQKRSQDMIRHMMESDTTNCYTISKNGAKKIIFQSPWKDDNGEVQGMVEVSIILPEELHHYQR